MKSKQPQKNVASRTKSKAKLVSKSSSGKIASSKVSKPAERKSLKKMAPKPATTKAAIGKTPVKVVAKAKVAKTVGKVAKVKAGKAKVSSAKVTNAKVAKPTKDKTRKNVAVETHAAVMPEPTLNTRIEILPVRTKSLISSVARGNRRGAALTVTRKKVEGSDNAPSAKRAKLIEKGKLYSLDLRIDRIAMQLNDSSLDMCAALLRLAKVKGLDSIALTGPEWVVNLPRLQSLREKVKGVSVIPGFSFLADLELARNVNFIALFPESYTTDNLKEILSQLGVTISEMLAGDIKMQLDFPKILTIIEQSGGIIIPSQVDRSPHYQAAIPELVERYGFEAFDLVLPQNDYLFLEKWPNKEFTFMSFSCANTLAQVGHKSSRIRMPSSGFEGIKAITQRS